MTGGDELCLRDGNQNVYVLKN